MIHKKRDVFSESKGVLTHSIHNYRDDKLELHPWSVRNSRHVKSELMGQLTSLIQNYRNVKFELIGSEHPLVQYYRHVSFELVRVSKGEEFKTSNNILNGRIGVFGSVFREVREATKNIQMGGGYPWST